MSTKPLLLTAILLAGMWVISTAKPTTVPVPFRSFCKVVWLVGIPCSDVNMAIVTRIKALSHYKLGTAHSSFIEANHTSDDDVQVENVNFTMMATVGATGCRIGGSSTSQFWFSRLDNGTNYCNLYNVIQGSELGSAPGFIEFTNDWLCLGFELTAGCKV